MPTLATLAEKLYESTSSVIGQDRARRRLANALWRQAQIAGGASYSGAAVLMAGGSGQGKTYLAKMMCSACELPFAEANATQYTESGYVGLNLTQMYLPLLYAAAAEYDRDKWMSDFAAGKVEDSKEKRSPLDRPHEEREEIALKAANGILLLDEFDKWFTRKDTQGRDTGRTLQAELLRLIEGDQVWVSDSEEELGVKLDTSKILVIACGAFVGLADIVSKRMGGGEATRKYDETTAWRLVQPQDFIRYGMLPELAGRMSMHIMLEPLKEEALVAILDLPGGLLEEFKERFRRDGSELEVDEGAKMEIAKIAKGVGTGARSLRFVLEKVLGEALFRSASGHRGIVRLNFQAVRSADAGLEEYDDD